MKILLATPMPPSGTAMLAVPRTLHAQLIGLSERHDVTVATVAGPEEHELEAVERLASGGVDVHAACRHEPRTGSERWRRRRRLAAGWLGGRLPWRSVWYREPRLQEILDRLCAERSFDVIAAEDNAMGVYRFPHVAATVLMEHEVRRARSFHRPSGPPRTWPRAMLGELDWRRWPRYQRETWMSFDLVQTFTERDAEAMRLLVPELAPSVRVTPFGLELPPPLDPHSESPHELLFVGNFTHPPNVDAAIWLGTEIMPRIRALDERAHLTIVGPWAPPSVAALASAGVDVVGAVPDLRPFLAAAAVVLAPIRIGGGMRMKVLEALALGKAVVTTTRGTDGLDSAGDLPLIAADTANELARETARLLVDAQARRRLGERAQTFATENYSPAAYARRLEHVYDEARELRSRKGRR